MAGESYAQLLRHPKWQKKRLEVLERAGFNCEECGDDGTELHVHHLIYKRGRKPWEYEPEELAALCSDCHEHRHELKRDLDGSLQCLLSGELALVCLFADSLAFGGQMDRSTWSRLTGVLDSMRPVK